TGIAAGAIKISAAKLAAKSERAGRFALDGTAQGTLGERFSLAAGASLAIDRGAIDLRLARLDGALGGVKFALGAPLAASWRGTSGRFNDLALKIGDGTVSGEGALEAGKISLHLLARDLPVHALARLGGQSAEGALGFDLTLSGNRKAPQGRLIV